MFIHLPSDNCIRGNETFANFVLLDEACLLEDEDLPGERLAGDLLLDLVGLFLPTELDFAVLLDGLLI